MAAENELYSLSKVLEVYEEEDMIIEKYGEYESDYPEKVREQYYDLRETQRKYFHEYVEYYKGEFYNEVLHYFRFRVRDLPIESVVKEDILIRLDKINAIRTYINLRYVNNNKEIKNIPYIRNTFKKIRKNLIGIGVYNSEDEVLCDWVNEYIGFILVYYNSIDRAISEVYLGIKKHGDLDFLKADLEKIEETYDNGEFIETYFNLEKLVSKVTYLDEPLPNVKQLLEKYGYSK